MIVTRASKSDISDAEFSDRGETLKFRRNKAVRSGRLFGGKVGNEPNWWVRRYGPYRYPTPISAFTFNLRKMNVWIGWRSIQYARSCETHLSYTFTYTLSGSLSTLHTSVVRTYQ